MLGKNCKGPKNIHNVIPFTYISIKVELDNIEFINTHTAKL